MIKRTLYVISSMKCCRDDEIVYEPKSRDFQYFEEKKRFRDSLIIWRDKREDIFRKMVMSYAEDECEGMGTPKLCYFEFMITNVTEEEK